MKEKNGGKRVLPWIVVFALCLTLFSSCMIATIMAKYVSTAGNDANAKVASFVFDTLKDKNKENFKWVIGSGGSDETTVDDVTDATLTFKAKNYTGESGTPTTLSEVFQKYGLTIKAKGDLPLQFTLTKNGAKVTAISDAAFTTLDEEGITVEKTFVISDLSDATAEEMQPKVPKLDTYVLTAHWIDGKPYLSGETKMETITIALRAKQETITAAAD